jgi:hypothetical protein
MMTESGRSGADAPSVGLGHTASIPNARQMQMQWHTEAGEVLFYYPSNLSTQDAADLRALIEIAFKGIDRRASAHEQSERTGA